MKQALTDIGVENVETFVLDEDPQASANFSILMEKMDVPKNFKGFITVAIDDRFLFIGNEGIPIDIIIDFIQNHFDDHDKLIVYRDELSKLYQLIDEKGSIKECEIGSSIEECEGDTIYLKQIRMTLFVMASGLIDGINPCAFAVLLFFVSIMKITEATESSGKNRRFLLVGSTYIASVFISYFVIGLGILQAVRIYPFPRIIGVLGSLLVFFLGILNLKDYVGIGGFTLGISGSHWDLIREWMRKFTVPAALIIGVMVSFFEFPCTGGVYLAILGLLAIKSTFIQGIVYLIVYNLMFILPLIAIFVSLLRVENVEFSLAKWKKSGGKTLKLISGLLMIVLSLIFLFYMA